MSDLFSTVKNATNPTHISNYYPYMQRNMEDYKKERFMIRQINISFSLQV